jgi:hypothetical protein
MSKWRKALKNNRRFDARYFLNERVESEEVVENSVQQEEVKRNFNDFSFDSWLAEDQDLEEAHCNSKRDDDDKELEEGQKSDEDGDGVIDSDDYMIKKNKAIKAAMNNEAVEEELEELQVHPHTAKDFSGAVVPIKDEEPPVKKKKNPETDPDLMRRSRAKQMRANAAARRAELPPVKSES